MKIKAVIEDRGNPDHTFEVTLNEEDLKRIYDFPQYSSVEDPFRTTAEAVFISVLDEIGKDDAIRLLKDSGFSERDFW